MAILGVLGAGLVLGLFFVSHNIEKQKAQRALMVANIGERVQQLNRLIDATPPAYLNKDLKLLIQNEIKKRIEKLTELAPEKDNFRKGLESISAQINETQSSTTKPPTPQIKSPEEAEQIRNVLQQHNKLIEALVQNKTIPLAEGKKHIAQIQASYFEAKVNHSINLAEQNRMAGKTKLAIHNYHKAIAELTKHNQNNMYAQKIAELKGVVGQLQEETGVQGQTTEKATSTDDALSQGLDELLEEDNSWKKKYFWIAS